MFVCRIKENQATSIYPSHCLKLIKIDFFVLFTRQIHKPRIEAKGIRWTGDYWRGWSCWMSAIECCERWSGSCRVCWAPECGINGDFVTYNGWVEWILLFYHLCRWLTRCFVRQWSRSAGSIVGIARLGVWVQAIQSSKHILDMNADSFANCFQDNKLFIVLLK